MGIGHSAGDFRPLNLSNSDNKVLALALIGRLSELCQTTVASPQRGFVAGRHIEDNLFGFEAAAISLSATNLKRSAIILFDFRTAFPSLAHDWVFAVLSQMGIPSYFFHAGRQLDFDCSAMLLFNGAELDSLPRFQYFAERSVPMHCDGGGGAGGGGEGGGGAGGGDSGGGTGGGGVSGSGEGGGAKDNRRGARGAASSSGGIPVALTAGGGGVGHTE